MGQYRDVLTPVALAAVGVILVAIHLTVPARVQRTLVFDHAAVSPWSPLTAAYVHASDDHLIGNLAGYAVVAFYGCWVAVRHADLPWFRRAATLTLTVVPVLTNVTTWAVFAVAVPTTSIVSRGFSGVVAAFGGLLLVATYRLVRTRYDPRLGRGVGFVLALLIVLPIDARYGAGLSLSVAALSLAGVLIVLVDQLYNRDATIRTAVSRQAAPVAVTVALVGGILAALSFALFPVDGDLVNGGAFTNVIAHGVGLCYGVLAGLVARYW